MKLLTLALALIVALNTSSQVAREIPDRPTKVFNGPTGHGLGVVLSLSNGKGLAYRYWKGKYGFHASFVPIADSETKYYNAGLTGYCKLRQYEIGTLFLHAGAEYVYFSEKLYPYTTSIVSLEYNHTREGLNFGFGPGLHINQKYISFDVFAGYGAYIRNHESSYEGYDQRDEVITTVTAGVAFFLEL